jgi:NTP pyrophosphatase (non-canonical NTP hydrolase)
MGSYLEEDLANLAQQVHQINVKNGWYDFKRTPGDEVALLHSEVAELFECIRNNQWTTSFEGEDNKPVGAHSECADILIRLMDFCNRYNINLGKEVETKLEYNKSRSYRHGGKVL